MQVCRKETLKHWLRAHQERDHVCCLTMFEQILEAVDYIHSKGLMHRDLKPSNIFFSSDGSVKVGDFGLVTAYTSENDINLLIKDDKTHTHHVGTELYMSPEQVEGKAYSYKVDIFALGLIFFELFYSFGTEMERMKVISDVKGCVLPSDFETKMPLQTKLVQWLLSANPEKRPNANEVTNSDILREVRQEVQRHDAGKE
ncbi:eukaryotic translation initiation factor 2-alpha kinase 3-like [Oculina patagonica]